MNGVYASCLRGWYGALLRDQLELQGNKAPFGTAPIGPCDSFSTNGAGAFEWLAGVYPLVGSRVQVINDAPVTEKMAWSRSVS